MKKFLLLSLLLLVLSATSVQAQPKAKFESMEWEIPNLTKWFPFRVHAFKFVNEGDKPLVLYGYEAACGCTDVKFRPAPIPPGGEGVITVVFSAKNLRPGYFFKSVHVTNNTEESPFKLLIKGEMKKR